MFNKQVTRFVCQKCGAEFPKWQGQCSQCGEWNSLVETVVSKTPKFQKAKTPSGGVIKPLKLSQVKSKTFKRIKTGIGELDRVLGGGIVPGSVILVAGEPGIGKSTLLTQLALKIAKGKRQKAKSKRQKKRLNTKHLFLNAVLYVCGEESPQQIKLRINRFSKQFDNLTMKQFNNLMFLPETNIENILSAISNQPSAINLIIIDSIQTLWTENLTGSAGSVGQVRQCSQMLLTLAKKTNIPVFLIGHITKEGMIAGPKVLEHLVDTVLYLEGDKEHDFRILRANKNRFGPTDEVGIFTMTDEGMEEVGDLSKIFLSGEQTKSAAGRAVTITIQGIRPMLVEIQALVVPTQLPMPRRVASGIDYKRLQVLCAVLQKRLNLPLYQSDVFVNVAGGLKLTEPAADLAICLAVYSSFKNKPLPLKSVSLGEVGLLGEIRKVCFMGKRIKEAKRLGYKIVIGEKERGLRQTLSYLK